MIHSINPPSSADDDAAEVVIVSPVIPTDKDNTTAAAVTSEASNISSPSATQVLEKETETNENHSSNNGTNQGVQDSINSFEEDPTMTTTTKTNNGTKNEKKTTMQTQQDQEQRNEQVLEDTPEEDQNDNASTLPREELSQDEEKSKSVAEEIKSKDFIDSQKNSDKSIMKKNDERSSDANVTSDQEGTNNGTEQKASNIQDGGDIEWLKPSPKESDDNSNKSNDSTDKAIAKPLKMLKKGAVAVAGGTMVGVGLVMIPLPTPFGAVVASSGLAVLGTEFGEAKQLNDRIIDGAKGHFNSARDKIVEGIENMNSDGDDDDDGGGGLDGQSENVKKEGDGGAVIKVDARSIANSNSADGAKFQGDKRKNNNTSIGSSENKDVSSESESINTSSDTPPVWLHMNPIERARQMKLAKAKYRRENQSPLSQAKEAFTKKTGKFLSKNILPFIKKKEKPPQVEEVVDFTGKTAISVVESKEQIIINGTSEVTAQNSSFVEGNKEEQIQPPQIKQM